MEESAQDPSFGDSQSRENGRVPRSERPQYREVTAAQESPKGLTQGHCLQGHKGWAFVTTMFHPGPTSGQELSLKVGKREYYAIQGKKKVPKAVNLKKKNKNKSRSSTQRLFKAKAQVSIFQIMVQPGKGDDAPPYIGIQLV